MFHVLLMLIMLTVTHADAMLISAARLRLPLLATSAAAHSMTPQTTTTTLQQRSLWSPSAETEAPYAPLHLIRVLHAWKTYSTEFRTYAASTPSGQNLIRLVDMAETDLLRLIRPFHIKEIVKREDTPLLAYIVEKGVNCNIAGYNSPVHQSLYHVKTDALKILLRAHVDANVTNEYGHVPLHHLAKRAAALRIDFERTRELLLKALLLTQAGAWVSRIKGPLPSFHQCQEFGDLLTYMHTLQTSEDPDTRQHAQQGIDFIKQEYFIEPEELILSRLVEE